VTDQPALKLSVELGEYACIWYLPDGTGGFAQVHGFATFEGGRGAHGFGFWSNVPLRGESFPQVEQHPSIRCDLSTGEVATFVNASVITMFPERVRISASIVLVGFTKPASTSAEVCTVRFQVTGQDAVTGYAPLTRTILFPKAPGEMATYRLGAREGATIGWEDESAHITSDFAAASATADLYRVDHRFSPHFTVELDEPIPIGEFANNWADPVRYIVALATGQRQDITMLSATGEDATHEDGNWTVFSSGVTQAPFNSSGDSVFDTPSALSLGPDDDSLLRLVRRWVELRDQDHPIIHLFARQVGAFASLPSQATFQVLIQAIEGAHRAENPEKLNQALASHQHERDKVLGLLKEAGANAKVRGYTANAMGKYPPGNLNDALEWVDSVVPGSFAAQAGPLTLVQAQMSGDDTWADGLRKIRNDLAHGNSTFPRTQLREVVRVVHRFATALALNLLGASHKAQERALRSHD